MIDPTYTPTAVIICQDGGTWTIEYHGRDCGSRITGSLTGYRNHMADAIEYARARGLLLIDWRTAPFSRAIRAVISGPMRARGDSEAEPGPWRSMSYAPAWYCAELARLAGATVENAPPIPADAAHLAPTEAFFAEKESA